MKDLFAAEVLPVGLHGQGERPSHEVSPDLFIHISQLVSHRVEEVLPRLELL